MSTFTPSLSIFVNWHIRFNRVTKVEWHKSHDLYIHTYSTFLQLILFDKSIFILFFWFVKFLQTPDVLYVLTIFRLKIFFLHQISNAVFWLGKISVAPNFSNYFFNLKNCFRPLIFYTHNFSDSENFLWLHIVNTAYFSRWKILSDPQIFDTFYFSILENFLTPNYLYFTTFPT